MFRRDARENEKIQYSNVLDFQGKTPIWTPACEVDFESSSSTNSNTPATLPQHYTIRLSKMQALFLPAHVFVEMLAEQRQ